MQENKNLDEDFLEVDPEIPGQKYVCLSFVSPESLIRDKQTFYIHSFLKSLAKDFNKTEEQICDDYKNYLYTKEKDLQETYDKTTDYKTSVRGIKIRGTYSTLKEAQVRAKIMQRRFKNFHVYVGQVGYWLPWNPTADSIQNEEFLNDDLNNLMKKYKENMEERDVVFDDYKNKKVELAKKEYEENRKLLDAKSQDDEKTPDKSTTDTETTTEQTPVVTDGGNTETTTEQTPVVTDGGNTETTTEQTPVVTDGGNTETTTEQTPVVTDGGNTETTTEQTPVVTEGGDVSGISNDNSVNPGTSTIDNNNCEEVGVNDLWKEMQNDIDVQTNKK